MHASFLSLYSIASHVSPVYKRSTGLASFDRLLSILACPRFTWNITFRALLSLQECSFATCFYAVSFVLVAVWLVARRILWAAIAFAFIGAVMGRLLRLPSHVGEYSMILG